MENYLKHWALKRTDYWWDQLNQIFKTNFIIPEVQFSEKLKVTAGFADQYQNIIKLSSHFIKEEGVKYESTISHELAHIFAYQKYVEDCGHDVRWQQIMIKIGQKPERCHNYASLVRKKVVEINITCHCGIVIPLSPILVKRLKTKPGYTRICCKCKSSINSLVH